MCFIRSSSSVTRWLKTFRETAESVPTTPSLSSAVSADDSPAAADARPRRAAWKRDRTPYPTMGPNPVPQYANVDEDVLAGHDGRSL